MKHTKESIVVYEIFKYDIENTTKNVKSSEEAVEVVNEMEKIIKSKKSSICGLPTNKAKYFKYLN